MTVDHSLALFQLRMFLAHEELRLAIATPTPTPVTISISGNYLGGIKASIEELEGHR